MRVCLDDPMVTASNLRKSFGGRPVLDGLSLAVGRGEIVCIIGPSGAGKSTLLRCLNGLEGIDAGRIVIDRELLGCREVGGRLHALKERQTARQRAAIGMVFQDLNLFPHLTVIGNLAEAPMVVRGISRREAEARARSLLERVGLAAKAQAYPETLSGGEQQRVAIARALAMEPKLMLLDEPTSALDLERVGEILAIIRELVAEGMTTIIVTHEIAFAREIAHRVIFMDAGRIVEEGPPHDILARPKRERTRFFLSRVA